MGDPIPTPQQQAMQQLIGQIDAAEARGQSLELERLCNLCLKEDPANWSVWERLARSQESRGALDQAETLWRHLTKRFNQRAEPFVALAALLRRLGTPEAARIVLEQALLQQGPSAALQASLHVLDDPWINDPSAIPSLDPSSPAQQVAALLELVRAHLLHGRLPEAEASLEQLVNARPQSLQFHLQLAELRWRRGDASAVIAQLLPSYQPLPENIAAFAQAALPLLLVEALLQHQRPTDAEPILAALRHHHPEDLQVQLLSADLFYANGLDLQALQLLDAAASNQPLHHGLQRRLGELNQRLGHWTTAIDHFRRAVAIDPRDPGTRASLDLAEREQRWWQAEGALEQGQWSMAGVLYRELFELEPGAERVQQRLRFLQSLSPEAALVGAPPVTPGSASQRLALFAACLDRIEAALDTQA
jgi:tetratricopeptide (TPR) repeat protein